MVKNRGGENGIIFPGGENGISPLCIDNLMSVLECGACMHENMQENTSQSISLIDRFLSPSL